MIEAFSDRIIYFRALWLGKWFLDFYSVPRRWGPRLVKGSQFISRVTRILLLAIGLGISVSTGFLNG